MKSSRLEAFSDGVLAIIITIMVLELKAPEETNFESLFSVLPIFISYLVSFIYVGIYWNSHHHLFQITDAINGKVLWANLHLLFWLSLIPFTTSWVGENHVEAFPVALYGFVFLMSAIAFYILKNTILNNHLKDHPIHQVIGSSKKEYLSMGVYLIGIVLAFFKIYIALLLFVGVGLVWFIPDSKIEKNYKNE